MWGIWQNGIIINALQCNLTSNTQNVSWQWAKWETGKGDADGNTKVSQKRMDREEVRKRRKKKLERESAQARLSIFRLRVQSTGSVIISWFGVFLLDQYNAGRPRAQGLWFTIVPFYYSGCVCLCDVHVSGVVYRGARIHRKRCREQRENRCCTFSVFLQERFAGWKETILTHSCLGLHSQPFFSSARRHSDRLVHLQTKDQQLPSASAPPPLNTRPQKYKYVYGF